MKTKEREKKESVKGGDWSEEEPNKSPTSPCKRDEKLILRKIGQKLVSWDRGNDERGGRRGGLFGGGKRLDKTV